MKMTVDNFSSANSIDQLKYSEKNFDELSLSVVSSVIDEDEPVVDNEKKKSIWRKFAGILLTITAALCFTTSTVLVKFISEVSVSEITTYRNTGMN